MSFLVIVSAAAAALTALLAAFALFREPRVLAARAFFVGMLAFAAESVCCALGAASVLPDRILFWQTVRFVPMALLPATWLVFAVTYSRADHKQSLRSWLPAILAIALGSLLTLAAGYRLLTAGYATPVEPTVDWLVVLGPAGKALHVLLILAAALVLTNLERTFRTAVGTMRWRVKFMVLSIGMVMAVRIYTSSQALLYSAGNPTLTGLDAGTLVLATLLTAKALARARLLNVDLYVSHTVLFRSTTILLCGLYLLAIGLLARLFTRLGGIPNFPLHTLMLFAAILGLGALLASDRIRIQSKRFVSRHFKRPQYDYQRVWTRFREGTAGLMQRTDFCRAVVRLVSETFEALSVSVWLTDSARGVVFGASTSLSQQKARSLLESFPVSKTVASARRELHEPFDLEASVLPQAEALRQCNPGHFPGKGGRRICVPLPGAGNLLGFMVVGDRVRGVPFTSEEMELLKTVGEQTGAGLLNIDLSENLLEAKQMEAFQTMSTFFVHDLKNTASTLSLMLQNLPKHFDDPEFRKDALGTISRSVSRIDQLIARLSALRKCVAIETAATDLNRLTQSVVDGLGEALSPRVRTDFDPKLPPVPLDAAQMQKVITNLVLNALDAGGEDEVRVATSKNADFAQLEVTDKGRGMTREFIEKDLFKPFRSTKKDGMGIGLFQSKMIVEAHRGRIEVESEPDKGSTFRLYLPLGGDANPKEGGGGEDHESHESSRMGDGRILADGQCRMDVGSMTGVVEVSALATRKNPPETGCRANRKSGREGRGRSPFRALRDLPSPFVPIREIRGSPPPPPAEVTA